MMNALRLRDGFAVPLFTERTGLPLESIRRLSGALGATDVPSANGLADLRRGPALVDPNLVDPSPADVDRERLELDVQRRRERLDRKSVG